MQDRQNTRQRAEMTLDRTEFLHGLGGHAHQQAVHELLMTSEGISQLRWHCRHGVEIVTRQQLSLAFFEPLLGLRSMAFRAGPVAATVEHPKGFAAVITSVQPTAQLLGAAGCDIRKGSFVRRHHHVAVVRPILRTKLTNHVGQFDTSLGKRLVRVHWARARINHGWTSFPRRDPRWSGGAVAGDPLAKVRSGGCRSQWIECSNVRAESGSGEYPRLAAACAWRSCGEVSEARSSCRNRTGLEP